MKKTLKDRFMDSSATADKSSVKKGLNIQKEVYLNIFEHSPFGVYLMTPEEKIVNANSALAGILGYETSAELLREMGSDKGLFYVKPELSRKFIRLAREKSSIKGYETQCRRKDGSKVWISENIATIKDAGGIPLYCIGTVQDITERKKQVDGLVQEEEKLRELLRKTEEDREFFADTLKDMCDSYNNLDKLFIDIVEAIACAFDNRFMWSKGHSKRVAQYATAIARRFGLNDNEIETLRIAALLHDIGKINSDDILSDNKTSLTNREFEIIKKHPLEGAAILDRIKYRKDIIPIVRHHHERMDGKGYPDGLKGNAIPLCARILHLAESFDSMTKDRPYRPAPGKEFAFSEFKRCVNTQFDPDVTKIAIKVL